LATAENKVINIEEIDRDSPHNLELSISSDTLAYIMYTSGSTETSVMQTHRNLCSDFAVCEYSSYFRS
jgi:long-subunit acyl-CoA synthetase (AMP-forming)